MTFDQPLLASNSYLWNLSLNLCQRLNWMTSIGSLWAVNLALALVLCGRNGLLRSAINVEKLLFPFSLSSGEESIEKRQVAFSKGKRGMNTQRLPS